MIYAFLKWYSENTSVDVSESRHKVYWDFRINGFLYEVRYIAIGDKTYTINIKDISEDPTDEVGVPVWGY